MKLSPLSIVFLVFLVGTSLIHCVRLFVSVCLSPGLCLMMCSLVCYEAGEIAKMSLSPFGSRTVEALVRSAMGDKKRQRLIDALKVLGSAL